MYRSYVVAVVKFICEITILLVSIMFGFMSMGSFLSKSRRVMSVSTIGLFFVFDFVWLLIAYKTTLIYYTFDLCTEIYKVMRLDKVSILYKDGLSYYVRPYVNGSIEMQRFDN